MNLKDALNKAIITQQARAGITNRDLATRTNSVFYKSEVLF